MDKTAYDILSTFADQSLTSGTEDWERLYHFTLYVHRRGLNTQHQTIRDYLIQRGYSIQRASWLSTQYRHFTKLLTLYDQHKFGHHLESPQSGNLQG